MPRFVLYHPSFEIDVNAARDWYEERSVLIGDDFLNCVYIAAERLIADPDSRSVVDFGIPYWPVERFPYVVFYDLSTSMILMLGVMHTSQDATKWLKRRR